MLRILLIFSLFILQLNAKTIDAIAVIVGDQIITTYDIQKEAQITHMSLEQARDMLIRKKLEDLEIQKRHINVSEDEVYEEIRRVAASNHMSISQFYDAVRQSNGLNSTQLKEKIKERLLSQKLYQSIAMSKMQQPTQAELEEYYKLHIKEFSQPSFFDVIIYSAKEKTLLQQKMQNPMFYSPSIQQQAQRIQPQLLSPQLKQLLLQTPQGSFTPIIPNPQGGYMTIYIQEVGEASQAEDFEKIKPRIINAMMNEKRMEILDDYFAKLKNSTNVKILRK
ncbi:MAG: peptidyl-prolyl cis-trans isomerase [Epsilonproteobacteria bacterium]|nr:peptidyl-prolyl cis-trans isomerase [Campylobacterota bacterium]